MWRSIFVCPSSTSLQGKPFMLAVNMDFPYCSGTIAHSGGPVCMTIYMCLWIKTAPFENFVIDIGNVRFVRTLWRPVVGSTCCVYFVMSTRFIVITLNLKGMKTTVNSFPARTRMNLAAQLLVVSSCSPVGALCYSFTGIMRFLPVPCFCIGAHRSSSLFHVMRNIQWLHLTIMSFQINTHCLVLEPLTQNWNLQDSHLYC